MDNMVGWSETGRSVENKNLDKNHRYWSTYMKLSSIFYSELGTAKMNVGTQYILVLQRVYFYVNV